MVSSSPSPGWCPDVEYEDIDAMLKDLEDPVSEPSTKTSAADSSKVKEEKNDYPEPYRGVSKGSSTYEHRPSRNSIVAVAKNFEAAVESRRNVVQTSQHEWWSYKFAHIVAWIVQILFTLASLVLLALWIRHVHPEAYVVTFFVMSIAAAAYFAKVTGMGDAVIAGRKVPIIRYIDWIATTPLMLFELCMIGGAKKHTTIFIIGCDLMMLVGGIVSAMFVPKAKVMLKYVWFLSSIIFYALMIVALQVDVAQGTVKKRPKDVQMLFSQLEWLTIVSWTGYPIVVLLGRAHAGLISKGMEDALLCILDCISKLGMEGFVIATCSAEGAQCHVK